MFSFDPWVFRPRVFLATELPCSASRPEQICSDLVGASVRWLWGWEKKTSQLKHNISSQDYLAMSQLPLTYPWSHLVFDMKELLPAWDRHLTTVLISCLAGHTPIPHSGTSLAAFLKHLAQIVVNIVKPQSASLPPQCPFVTGILACPLELRLPPGQHRL